MTMNVLVRYLHADRNSVRITKADKNFAKKLDSKDTKFLAKVRDIHTIERKNSIGISSLFMKIRTNIQSMSKKML